MRKFFVLLCIFSLFLSLSCSKKSESNENSPKEVVTSEETSKINNENNTDIYGDLSDDKSDDNGLEGFMFDDEESSSEFSDDYYDDSYELSDNNEDNSKSFSFQSDKENNFLTDGQESEEEKEPEPEPEPVIEMPKDSIPPAPITNLTGYYNGAKDQVVISWTAPGDEDFSHVEITSNGKKAGKAKKGTNTYGVTANSLGNYNISVVSYDYSGNPGPAVSCSVEAKFFDSISLPVTGDAGFGRPVRAVVKGINFSADGVTADDFKVSCKEDSSVSKKAKVRIVNDNTVYVDVSIPRNSGTFNVNVSCGNNNVSGPLKVRHVDAVGTVERASDGTAVAVLAGYNSFGLPFGVALKEQKGMKWATDFGYSEKFEKIMAVIPQEQLGAGSAINATITGDLDGEDNWKAIAAEDKKTSNLSYVKEGYPLFYYALNYGNSMPAGYKDGWYIPSIYELCQIYKNKAKINEVMSTIGGKQIGDDFYWSSSQCDEEDDKACAVRFDTGSIFKYKRKSDSVFGRCVIMMD